MSERQMILARFLRSQIALANRPPVGRVELNNEEAGMCAQALEQVSDSPAPLTSKDEVIKHLQAMLDRDMDKGACESFITPDEEEALKAAIRLLHPETTDVPQTCTEKDAARYEWLRENWKGLVCHTSCSPSGRQVDLIEVVETLGQDLDPQSLDHAIDAAIKADDERSAVKTSAEPAT